MKSVRWLISYIFVSVLGLWLAFAISAKFMAPAYSQNTPASGELPPEFLKEVESTQAPSQPPPGNNQPAVQKPVQSAPSSETVKQGPAQPQQPSVPPPPPAAAETPIGEGATAVGPSDLVQEEYKYDPTGKRDPFAIYKTVRPSKVDGPKSADSAEPLQKWELDRLQVVGILWDVRIPRAMVQDPDGALYTIIKNSKIGRNEGFVAAIREGEIVIVETLYSDGQPARATRVMELKK